MNNNRKIMLLLSLTVILIVGIGMVSAADSSNQTVSTDNSVSAVSNNQSNSVVTTDTQVSSTTNNVIKVNNSNNNQDSKTVSTVTKTDTTNSDTNNANSVSKDTTVKQSTNEETTVQDTSNSNQVTKDTTAQVTTKNTTTQSTNLKSVSAVTVDSNAISSVASKSSLKTSLKGASNTVTVNNYQELIDAVNKAKNDSSGSYTINLASGDYNITQALSWGNATGTTRNLTINGNGLTLDGQNTYSFISNVEKGYVFNLNNITIQDTKCAINSNGLLNVNNSIFVNNSGDEGSAIQSRGENVDGSVNTINNSVFINNYALNNFGAIITLTNMIIDNSTFINNSATMTGGAVGVSGDKVVTKIINSRFSGNYVTQGYGGAIDAVMGGLIVNNCNFTDNKAASDAGAIHFVFGSLADVENSTFINNSASGNGGAVADMFEATTIKNDTFINNTATNGGAIYTDGDIITNITAIGNKATTNGGVIYTDGSTSLNNSVLVNNTANNGAIIYNTGASTLFTNNSASNNYVTTASGFVIYNTGTGAVISNNNFTGNTINRDMLISSTTSVNVNNNYYSNNLLNTTIEPISDQTVDKNVNYTVNVDLRNVYNGTVTNGTITVYLNTAKLGNFSVTNGKANISIPLSKLYKNTNVTLVYTSLDKDYQNSSTTFKITTNKVDTTFIVVDHIDDTAVNTVVQINATLFDDNGNPLPNHNITLTINGVNHTFVTDANGLGTYNYQAGTAGKVVVSAIFNGTDGLSPSVNSTIFYIYKLNSTVTATVNTGTVGTNVTLTANVLDNEKSAIPNGTVNVYENNVLIGTGNVTDGIVNIPLSLTSGDHTLFVNYTGTENYNGNNTTITVSINKIPTTITINPIGASNVTNNVTISGTLTDVNGNKLSNQNVTIEINNNYNITVLTDSNGLYTTTYTTNTTGFNTITVTYNGTTSTYLNTSTSGTFRVNKLNTNIQNVVLANNTATNVTVNLVVFDQKNNQVKNGTVYVYENGVLVGTANLTDTITSIKVNVTSGDHNLSIIYGGTDNFNKNSTTLTVSIVKINTGITTKTTNTTATNTTVVANITDVNGNPVDNGTVNVYENNTLIGTYKVTNGTANITLPTLPTGEHNLTINYTGTDKYNVTNTTAKVTVTPMPTTITVDPIGNTDIGQNVSVTGALTDENGKVIPNDNVTITVNGVDTIVKTNSTGGYNYTFTADTTGVNNITVTYKGNNLYNQTNATTKVNINKMSTTITVDPIGNTDIGQNVSVTGALTDENGKVIPNANVTITVNGVDTIVKTNSTGGYNYTFTVDTTGVNNITVTYKGDDLYNQTNATTTFNVGVTDTKGIITINPVNNATIGQNVTVNGTLTDENGKAIPNTNIIITVNGVNTTVTTDANGEYTYTFPVTTAGINNITATYGTSSANTTFNVNKLNINMTTKVTNTTATNVTVVANITDSNGNPVDNGTVVVYENGTVIGTFNVTNGTANITLPNLPAGEHNLTIKYPGTDKYNATNTTVNVNVTKMPSIITVDPITYGMVEDKVLLNATVTDENGKLINGGVIVFKINGETLKYANGTPIYVNVTNGKAQLEYTIPHSWVKSNMTIGAAFSGTDVYTGSRATNKNINIVKRDALIEVVTSEPTIKANDTTVLTAIVADKITGKYLETGIVVFKFQGHTLKDANGTPIYVNVTNGIAELNYTAPIGISSHNYTVTAVYANPDYNRAQNTTKQFVNKTKTSIKFTATKSTNITVTGTIKDILGNNVKGINKIAIKVNGVTVKDANNKTQYFYVKNGKINITLPDNTKHVNNVTIVTGDRLGYFGSTTTTPATTIKTAKQATKIRV